MDVTTPTTGPALEEAVERAAEAALSEAAPAALQTEPVAPETAPGEGESAPASGRELVTVATTVLAAAVVVGGIFIGPAPRIWAAIGGILGLLVARAASRTRNPWLVNAWVVGGIFLIGVALVLPSGAGAVLKLGKELRVAAHQGDLLRPPVLFQPGWRLILGWVMGCVGFGAGWIALEMRRPALGLIVPVPLIAFGAVSIPKSQQLASGLVALGLLAAGLGLLSSLHERGAEDRPPGLAYEARRAVRALPVVGGVTLLLYFLSRSNLLFPPPLYDPTQQARLPKTVPLEQVQDRVLFEVRATFTGPWKLGTLDVYDGKDWRLPPFNEKAFLEVPVSGLVDDSLKPEAKAVFIVRGLTGAVLPGLSNTVGMIADVPKDMKISFDRRAGTLRVTQGQFRPGFKFTIVAAGIPNIDLLRSAPRVVPEPVQPFLKMPKAPPAVEDLLGEAPSDNLFDRMDFVRKRLLKTVRAAGQGVPKSVTPQRVGEMLTSAPDASPFEIVAAQAMLVRWAGVPARIGYGFDKGDKGPEENLLFVRPKDGALFLEVYFTGFGWLPIIGDPLIAKTDLTDAPQQFNANVAASDDVAVQLFIPVLDPPPGETFRLVRRVLGTVVPVALLLGLVYALWPLPYKALVRGRRRTRAVQEGPTARVALAYAEWRDRVTDFGYPYKSDPALLFLNRLAPDDEHAELAWLVTRVLWGDLQGRVTVDDAVAAEELSAALRQRLSRAHPWTLRAVASLSRLSVRDPYAPEARPAPSRAKRGKELARVA